MKLTLYLFKKFFPIFIGSLAFFSLVLVLVDLLMNIQKFIQNDAPVNEVLNLMLLYTPKTIWYALPLATLFAVSYSLSDFYASNELTAVFASGVSLFRFTLPLLIFSVVLSFGMFVFEDKVVVPTFAQKKALQSELLAEEKNFDNDSVVVLSDNGKIIYKAQSYEDSQQRLFDLFLVFRNEDKTLNAILHADSAYWQFDVGQWKLFNTVQWSYVNGQLICEPVQMDLLSRLVEPSETFRSNSLSIEEIDVRQAKIYIEHLKKVGFPYNEELSVYYKKFSYPFVVFIVVFLSVGLSGKSRKNVLLISLSLSVSAAVLFYVMQMLTMLLAKFSYISPFMGAWFPVFFFICISIMLLRFART